MAAKEYKLVRPSDGAEFTMLLDEEDKTKYEKAQWAVTETRRKNPTAPRDLSASKGRAAKAEDVTVTD